MPQPKSAALTTITQSAATEQRTDVATALEEPGLFPDKRGNRGPECKAESCARDADRTPAATTDSAVPGPKSIEPTPGLIELSFASDQGELKIGDKRQLALQVKSDAPLGLAVITLRFDPGILKIIGGSAGSLFASAKNPPTVTQSIDEHGMVLLSIAPASGSVNYGRRVLLNLDVEGVSAGDTALSFDLSNVHLVAG